MLANVRALCNAKLLLLLNLTFCGYFEKKKNRTKGLLNTRLKSAAMYYKTLLTQT